MSNSKRFGSSSINLQLRRLRGSTEPIFSSNQKVSIVPLPWNNIIKIIKLFLFKKLLNVLLILGPKI
jgi:hypothetical protein